MRAVPSPLPRLQRAIARKNLVEAEAAAREMPQVPLSEALGLVLLVGEREPARYDAFASRWLGRAALDGVGLESIGDLAEELRAAGAGDQDNGLTAACEDAGLPRCAEAARLHMKGRQALRGGG